MVGRVLESLQGFVLYLCGTGQISEIHEFFLAHQTNTRLIVWEKTNPSPMNGDSTWLHGVETAIFAKKHNATFNLHCKNTVIRHQTERCAFHPTPKPVDVMRRFVLASSNQGDVVLDPFMGSGTTAIACIREKRHFIGFELYKEYYEKANKRIKLELAQPTLF